ncbi:hypothetical protein SEVIR_9G537400v4 [Setaria viridis]|uniref:Uncharacterized protein n=2 Tax=Setaria TaxID=4554 RepID=K4AFJ2_SETIT|nr:formin-like protein 6 [Setaria italica]XP_034575148.1 formin-like protein 6 [Setaria viridis]RCV46451.1 hypothetical protein SETIT_9G533100v2 [Setaria italica]TKV98084.1 hypothetical protein SEVIR_9G537400v2 [Setaria viridis]
METLVISEQRGHQLHHAPGRRKKASSASPHFSSPQPVRGFQAGNCRAFHSGITIGILPSPPAPGVARTRSSPEPKTPKQQLRHGKKRSRAISISPSTSPPSRPELWAGPAFSNSPPPSSLPIPKFSLHQKRSVSLEFPPADRSDEEEVPVHAKSAPSSPTASSAVSFFSGNDAAIATENLRRILHLKIEDH